MGLWVIIIPMSPINAAAKVYRTWKERETSGASVPDIWYQAWKGDASTFWGFRV